MKNLSLPDVLIGILRGLNVSLLPFIGGILALRERLGPATQDVEFKVPTG